MLPHIRSWRGVTLRNILTADEEVGLVAILDSDEEDGLDMIVVVAELHSRRPPVLCSLKGCSTVTCYERIRRIDEEESPFLRLYCVLPQGSRSVDGPLNTSLEASADLGIPTRILGLTACNL